MFGEKKIENLNLGFEKLSLSNTKTINYIFIPFK